MTPLFLNSALGIVILKRRYGDGATKVMRDACILDF
jgi:hypothetical protein